jgi:hypothetical protein
MTEWLEKTHKYRPAIHLNFGARSISGTFFLSVWEARIGIKNEI